MRQRRLPQLAQTIDRLTGITMLIALLSREARRKRRNYTLEERLAVLPCTGLPIEQPVLIRWNEHQVPFIEAGNDHDLAFTLGLVHAHLRLGQIELMRRMAYGRVSEMIGAIGIETDRLLHTLDFGRAVPAILAGMPAATRDWLGAFVEGLNHYLVRVRPLPAEFSLFGLRPELWSVADVLTLGRLVSADVNWIVCAQLLRFREQANWPELWRKLVEVDGLASGTALNDVPSLPFLRSGSNSIAVASSRSARGAPMIASDPHLGIMLPNTWMLAACHSPSYCAVGLMLPGLPFVALGRNPWIAWGGTNLHAASSEFVAVPPEELANLPAREVELKVRWGSKRQIRIRESRWGPIVSDIRRLKAGDTTLALRWMGHLPSDETTAMLAANRARKWDEFRAAFEGFAVPGQNMLCADACGHIGKLMAVRVPRRTHRMRKDVVAPPISDDGWDTPIGSTELPDTIDPAEGFIASANERPQECDTVIGDLFSSGVRKRRLQILLARDADLTCEALARIQRDTHWEPANVQRQQLLTWLDSAGSGTRERRFIEAISGWDCCYDGRSRGALAFELWCFHLGRLLVPSQRRRIYGASWGTRRLIWDDIQSAEPHRRQRAVRRSLRMAAKRIGADETWGNRHRLRLDHPLALMPVLGRAWRFADLPAGGSADTLMKTAHKQTAGRHAISYGSMARHISDMSDPDRNLFVLLGGQDGWLGSTTFIDQVAVWQDGRYISLPLRTATARATFRHVTRLVP